MDLENLQAIICCLSHNYAVSKASLRQECLNELLLYCYLLWGLFEVHLV